MTVVGKRKEPRKDIKVPVRIFGTDSSGQIFSEKAFTVNVSREGAELSGVKAQPNIDEIIGLTYSQVKGHFRVRWVGPPGSPKAGHIGLLNLAPEKALWDFPLPAPTVDTSVGDMQDRRKHPRMKSVNSVELYYGGQTSPVRARTTDISLGGCFVEMPNPLDKGATLKLALWVRDTKIWAQAKVITSTPGYGIGVQFTAMSDMDRRQLDQFLESITRIPI
ncbi:MAG: PilZ domain-containing protein [Terriglobales bacterium]